MKSWKDDTAAIERLRMLLVEGKTFSQAGEALGVSRSAIACTVKQKRDGGTPGWEAGAFDANRSTAQRAVSTTKDSLPKSEKKRRKPRLKLVSSRAVIGLPLFDCMPCEEPVHIPVSRRVAFLDRKQVECSYMDGEDQTCCGALVTDRSLCAGHYALCYWPAKKPKPRAYVFKKAA